MNLRTITWPVAGQVGGAGLSAVATALIFYLFSPELASQYFGIAASVSIFSALAAFGQQRLLPRDIAAARRRSAPFGALVISRFRFTSIIAVIAGLLCGLFQFLISDLDVWTAVAIVLWTAIDGLRRPLADAHFGLHRDLRAVAVGDTLRWVVNLLGIVGYSALVNSEQLRGLVLIALASVAATALLAGCSLLVSGKIRLGRRHSRYRRLDPWEVRSGITNTMATAAAALTSQASVVTASVALPAADAATFAFGMRIAAGLTLVQSGLAKFVLPRAGVLSEQEADAQSRSSALRLIRHTTLLSASATTALLILAVAGFALLDGDLRLVWTIAILGVSSLLNVSAGPVGAVLVATHHETSVLVSNLLFGVFSLAAPMLYWVGLHYYLVVGAVGLSVILHNGVLASVAKQVLGVRLGLWAAPPLPTRLSPNRNQA